MEHCSKPGTWWMHTGYRCIAWQNLVFSSMGNRVWFRRPKASDNNRKANTKREGIHCCGNSCIHSTFLLLCCIKFLYTTDSYQQLGKSRRQTHVQLKSPTNAWTTWPSAVLWSYCAILSSNLHHHHRCCPVNLGNLVPHLSLNQSSQSSWCWVWQS